MVRVLRYAVASVSCAHACAREHARARYAGEARTSTNDGSAMSASQRMALQTAYVLCGCAITGGAGCCGVYTTTSFPVESG